MENIDETNLPLPFVKPLRGTVDLILVRNVLNYFNFYSIDIENLLCTHLLYPLITFLWHTLYFSLHMHSPIFRVIILIGRIIIDIIIL